MTDTEIKRLQAICEVANVDDIEDLSDGFHTFNDLYEQRMYLFAALVKTHKDKAWKSMRHEDGEMCFGGDWFIVGIDTPTGSYTYHYGIKYWDVFDCQILKTAKHWDGHTEKDVTRLLSLPSAQPEPSQVARDIATIIENEQDMRVMLSQPEIVRCKDCKHWINDHLCESLSRFGSFETKADFYCGYSERRTDECTD